MNHFTYADLQVGQEEEFSRTVTAGMMEAFRKMSGDENPLHVNDAFACKQGFPGRVVYGMLTSSLYSCLGGGYIPGENCLLQSVHADFLSPVFIGDTLSVHGQIKEKHDSVKQVVIKAEICNQDGRKVSKAVIKAGVMK